MSAFLRASFLLVLMAGMLLSLPSITRAQGSGATGAQILQFMAGSRAPALSGAYTAASGDADALFYNPAGVATLARATTLAFERYVADVSLTSVSGLLAVRGFTLGLSGLYLNSGEVNELVPDPDFGGNQGMPTGRTLSSSELAARLSVAAALGRQLRLGASAGLVSSALADVTRNAPIFDLGAQYELSFVTFGLAINNLGPAISGDDLQQASLPTEIRLGAATRLSRTRGLGLTLHTDLVARVNEGSAGLLVGAEGGWHASSARALGAVARLGYNAADGSGGLTSLKLGAGLNVAHLAFDYSFQRFELLGGVHRVGVRWTVAR